ncbi:MAG: SurA N-terminal domain-containing protein [Betaproteobacteria bacterium]|uniref:Periplasmic chaperone PpiD n=1 Tax=Candidatus Proximibacter danicus TaxID=2954365 RepID=A0A9D7K232_9PROT|nr:SurA N-terminal domain-containing protein [Candidatus Proximibacter danicus]
MFDAVRNNKRIVQGFLFLIAISFTLFGVDSYVRGTGAGTDVATVGDGKITQQQFQQSLRGQMDRARQQMGPSFKQELFDTPEMRLAVVNSLVDQRLLLLEAYKGRLGASNDMLVDIISNMPSLKENGQFSQSRYEAAVRAQGMSTEPFEAQLRQALTMQQLVGAVADTGIVSATSTAMMLRIQSEERQVAEIRYAPEQFASEVKLADDAARRFYDENQKLFQTPELVRAEFVVLSLDNLLSQVAVSDSEVKQWYESHKDRYQQAEERRASHILITVNASAPDAEKAKAKAKAEEVLKEVQKTPAKFAELAKKHSQDPGSAVNGGDLGFFGRGMMVKPFEESVFSQKDGQISGLVQSDFGFHIIKLTGIKAAKLKPLEEVRAEIEGELKRQGAQRRYVEAAEAFTNMVYEQSESLNPVAEKFKLQLQQSKFLPKEIPAQALPSLGPLGNEKLLAALFSEDAIKNKRNTDAVEVVQNTLVAARVAEHKPAAIRAFDTVRADIETMLKSKEASALAKRRGDDRLAELKSGSDKLNWALVKNVSRLQGKQVVPEALRAIFRADIQKLPAYVGVELPSNGGYALYKIMAVKPLDKLDESKQRVLQNDYTAMAAQEDFAAYLAGLRQRYKVEINKAVVESKDR